MTFTLGDHPSKLEGYRSILLNGSRVGYCRYGNSDPAPINLRVNLSESEVSQIREFVEREAGPVSDIGQPVSRKKLRRAKQNARKK